VLEASGQLPQDPPVMVGVVFPGMSGMELLKCAQAVSS
jgi:hypothetical protein